MNRMVVMLILGLIAAGIFLPDGSFASDGEVDYSAPYITVDPETGELVTVNPGPHLKVHQNPAVSANPDGAQAARPLPGAADQGDSEESGSSSLTVAVIGCAVVVLIALAGWWARQKRTDSSHAKG